MQLPSALHAAVFQATIRVQAGLRELRRVLGVLREPVVLPYCGYGSGRRLLVKARVIEARRPLPSAIGHGSLGHVVESLRRYVTHELPGVRVRVRIGRRSFEATTDEEGFVDLWLETTEALGGGWHEVELAVGERTSTARAFMIGPSSEYAVITDVDDTVIDTNVQNRLKRAYALFLAASKTRLPFEGVDAFYRALAEGRSGTAQNPIFYVSSSPWNIYEHIEEFLRLNEIPAGPILLRDWGVSRAGFAPDGRHHHKLDRIEEVIAGIGSLPLVLLGDSGQRDPEIYAEVVERHPGRVRAVFIRDVSRRPERRAQLARLEGRFRAAGAEFFALPDTVSAARRAIELGLIRPNRLWDVQQERDAQREQTTLLDRLEQPQS